MSTESNGAVRYVAFLKGINVGGHTVKMDRLRTLVGELGHEGVETYIASGNVIFSSSEREPRALEEGIASHLESTLGYVVPTFVRTTADLERIAAALPFPEDELEEEGSSLYIAFLPAPPSRSDAERIESAGTGFDRFRVAGSELYWHCRTRFSDSPFSGPRLEKLIGSLATVRNSTTIRKMAERYRGT